MDDISKVKVSYKFTTVSCTVIVGPCEKHHDLPSGSIKEQICESIFST